MQKEMDTGMRWNHLHSIYAKLWNYKECLISRSLGWFFYKSLAKSWLSTATNGIQVVSDTARSRELRGQAVTGRNAIKQRLWISFKISVCVLELSFHLRWPLTPGILTKAGWGKKWLAQIKGKEVLISWINGYNYSRKCHHVGTIKKTIFHIPVNDKDHCGNACVICRNSTRTEWSLLELQSRPGRNSVILKDVRWDLELAVCMAS